MSETSSKGPKIDKVPDKVPDKDPKSKPLAQARAVNLQPATCNLQLLFLALLIVPFACSLFAAEVDTSKLPPPANVQIEFERDVKPILEKSCWRCHGPERPKSHFRLDNRESALKGGDNGIDIIAGDSAKSPLIHYVARLVEDMEMPPPGKGDPLSPEQVGILRAWIDQGVLWGATNPPVQLALSAAPTLRWISVDGDKHKFREVEGIKEGFAAGIEQFSLEERIGPDKRVLVEGRALFPDEDFQVKLALEKTDFGFIRGGFEQWRRYYDDTGGYYRPFSVPAFDLGRDLHLDTGRAWFDVGLTLPNSPQIVLGYEYQFKEGDKSTLEWGAIEENFEPKNIYPAAKHIDEHVHIAKLDVTYDSWLGRLEDNARVELYDSKTRQDNASGTTLGPDTFTQTREGFTHIQGMNTIRLERQLTDWWLISGGYLYSRLEGDASMDQVTSGVLGPDSGFWSANDIVLKRESHIASLGNLFQPLESLTISPGVQAEWSRQEGFGHVHLDQGDPNEPSAFFLYPSTVESDLDKQKISENVLVRFTKIPWTVLFAEGRFDQESIGQFERDFPEPGIVQQPEITFVRDTDYDNDRREYRAGFNTSPWRWIALSAHYKNRVSDSDYDTAKTASPTGYPGFIRGRRLETDEVQAKLVLHPVNWLKTTFTYQLVASDYSTTTATVPGGTGPQQVLAGNYDANVYGLNAILTPFQRLYFSGTFTYSDSRTDTATHGSRAVVPYKGDIYAAMVSANYTLNPRTDLHAAYTLSYADYGQNNFADGLPLGLEYTRHGLMVGVTWRLTQMLTSNLRYGFFDYSEPTTRGVNDYTGHGVFATLIIKWPQ